MASVLAIDTNKFVTPNYLKVVTISPNPEIWTPFENHIIEKYGKRRLSRAVDILLQWFIDNADIGFDMNYTEYDKVAKTLSLNADTWTEYSEKLNTIFGKTKIKSIGINSLIKIYMNNN